MPQSIYNLLVHHRDHGRDAFSLNRPYYQSNGPVTDRSDRREEYGVDPILLQEEGDLRRTFVDQGLGVVDYPHEGVAGTRKLGYFALRFHLLEPTEGIDAVDVLICRPVVVAMVENPNVLLPHIARYPAVLGFPTTKRFLPFDI